MYYPKMSPNAVTPTNVEDEIRALRPTVIIPVMENEESEDESSVDGNVEGEVPPEGEPLGEEPEEAPLVDEADYATEEYEEVTDSSATSLASPTTSPTSPHVDHTSLPSGSPTLPTAPLNNFHVGESSRGTVRPRQDDPYMNFTPRQRIYSPEQVPYHTTPARYSLSGDPYRLPTPPTVPQYNPDFTLQIHRELQAIRTQQRDILDRQDFMERMAAYDYNRVNYRLDGFEIELMRLRSIVRDMSARLSRLEDANSRRRN